MKRLAVTLSVLGLAACAPSVPNSGVGFDDYNAYRAARAQREQVLTGQAPIIPDPQAIGMQPVGAPLAAVPVAAAPLPTTTAAAPMTVANNPGISDEQDFDAVSARESIESDAERLARLREQFQVIEPEPLPQRAGGTGPNIVAFALSTTNAVGQPAYRRSGFNSESRFQRACARFTTPDEAQRAFLSRGGPQEDPMGVDPDGDGFACFWDPSPFRAARGG